MDKRRTLKMKLIIDCKMFTSPYFTIKEAICVDNLHTTITNNLLKKVRYLRQILTVLCPKPNDQ